MSLTLRFKGGPFAGELREFDDRVERIRFGRDPKRCDVCFPESERAVSREHFALERVLGAWRVVTNGGSPVYVEGRLAHDGMTLALPCEIVVGTNGPCVLVDAENEAGMLSTHGERVAQPGAHTRIERVKSGLARQRLALTAAGVAVLGAGIWLAYDVRAGHERVELRLAELDASQSSALRGTIEEFARRNTPGMDLKAVLERARPSVFAVLAMRDEREPEPLGTAFSITGGRAATNAHVARVVLQRQGLGQRVVLRVSGATQEDVLVADAALHPGYEAFLGLMDEYRVLDPITGDALGLVPACDVALLTVGAADSARMPAPLELAPHAEAAELTAGEPVCAAGFPAEGLLGHGSDLARPAATTQSGVVTRVTDFFQGETGASAAQLVHHDLPGVGGASGSPVLDARGRVVALHSAGSFSFLPRFDLGSGGLVRNAHGEAAVQRIPTTGYFFAQRVDLLHELLDGTANTRQDARVREWRARFAELRERGHGFVRDHFTQQVATYFRREAEARGARVSAMPELVERKFTFTGGVTNMDARIDGELPAGFLFATAVASAPVGIEFSIVDPKGRVFPGQGPLGASCAPFEASASGAFHLRIARGTSAPADLEVDVRIVRIVTGP